MISGGLKDDERRYAAPPAGLSAKDDLHEWAIYRQNLTSSIAQNLLGDGKHRSPSKSNLPYGDFQMHDQAVESVLNRGKRTDSVGLLEQDGGEAYLRYGLPRVGLGWGSNTLRDRKSQSEMDLRRTVELSSLRGDDDMLAPRRGPYAVASATTDRLAVNQYGHRGGRRFQSVEQGLNMTDFAGGSHFRNEYAASELGYVPSELEKQSLRDFNTRGVNNNRGAYWQTKSRHHHGHYFSNLDLFAQSNAYNYLRYAKADDLGATTSKQPHFVMRNVGFSVGKKRVFDNLSLELFGGDTLAIMYTSG